MSQFISLADPTQPKYVTGLIVVGVAYGSREHFHPMIGIVVRCFLWDRNVPGFRTLPRQRPDGELSWDCEKF